MSLPAFGGLASPGSGSLPSSQPAVVVESSSHHITGTLALPCPFTYKHAGDDIRSTHITQDNLPTSRSAGWQDSLHFICIMNCPLPCNLTHSQVWGLGHLWSRRVIQVHRYSRARTCSTDSALFSPTAREILGRRGKPGFLLSHIPNMIERLSQSTSLCSPPPKKHPKTTT